MEYDAAIKNEDNFYAYTLRDLQDILLRKEELRCRKWSNKRGEKEYLYQIWICLYIHKTRMIFGRLIIFGSLVERNFEPGA